MQKFFLIPLVFFACVWAQQGSAGSNDFEDEFDYLDANGEVVSAPAPTTIMEPNPPSVNENNTTNKSPRCTVYSSCEKSVYESEGTFSSEGTRQTSPVRRGGFFMEVSLGGVFNYFKREGNYSDYDLFYGRYYDNSEEDVYSGFGPSLGLKLGGAIGGLFAPHFAFSFSRTFGTTEEDWYEYAGESYGTVQRHHEGKSSAVRVFIGGGFVGFASVSTMLSAYLGLDIGFVIGGAIESENWDYDHVGGIDDIGLGFVFDAGMLWDLSDRFYLGFGVNVSYDDAIDSYEEESSMWSIGVSLKFVRK